MRNQTPLAPGEPAFDVTVHIVLNDFGPFGPRLLRNRRSRR